MSLNYLQISRDPKTIKGEKLGYLTGILYLSPAVSSGINVCTHSSPGCREACLNTAGNQAYRKMIFAARIRKTRELFADRDKFCQLLADDIRTLIRKAKRENLIPCVRVNGTSDLPWLAKRMAKLFPDVQFYDYTKHPVSQWKDIPANYYLTFSHSENNLKESLAALQAGKNVAVVFDTKKGHALPGSFHGYRVVDGDLSDVRFLDAQGVVVGLRAKGRAKKDCSGFVIPARLIQIQGAMHGTI